MELRAAAGAHGASVVVTQISLTCSKGSRQLRQRRSALQAVAPNSESSSVSAEPQSGQDAVRRVGPRFSGTGPAARTGAFPGGAMPPAAACGGPPR